MLDFMYRLREKCTNFDIKQIIWLDNDQFIETCRRGHLFSEIQNGQLLQNCEWFLITDNYANRRRPIKKLPSFLLLLTELLICQFRKTRTSAELAQMIQSPNAPNLRSRAPNFGFRTVSNVELLLGFGGGRLIQNSPSSLRVLLSPFSLSFSPVWFTLASHTALLTFCQPASAYFLPSVFVIYFHSVIITLLICAHAAIAAAPAMLAPPAEVTRVCAREVLFEALLELQPWHRIAATIG